MSSAQDVITKNVARAARNKDNAALRCAADDFRVQLAEHMEVCKEKYGMSYEDVQKVNDFAHSIVEILMPMEDLE